jgi:hypothetical protein
MIISAGDSLVWGSELADCRGSTYDRFSKSTFFAKLADNIDYFSIAYPALTNRQIATRIQDALSIVTTKSTQHVGAQPTETYGGLAIPSILDCANNLITPNRVAFAVCWTWPSRDNELHSNDAILSTEQLLKQHSIPYVFTCADSCVITESLDLTKWALFPGQIGFYQWATANKYLCGPQQHPLEQAHQDAARLLQGKFNEMVKKFVQ